MAFMITDGFVKLKFRVEALKSQHSRQKPKASSTNLKGFGFSLYPKLLKDVLAIRVIACILVIFIFDNEIFRNNNGIYNLVMTEIFSKLKS